VLINLPTVVLFTVSTCEGCDIMGAEDANTATAMSGGKKLKVGVVGAAGGIGQPLALLLKISPLVGELSLFDVAPFTPGVCDA
jgi:hypothetical protein